MKVLFVLLVIAFIGYANAINYQYSFCKFITPLGSQYEFTQDSYARLYSNDETDSLNIEFHLNSTHTSATKLAAQILTYGYNPNLETKLGNPFNPTNVAMGCPGKSKTFRAGDIGNLNSDKGFVNQNVTLTLASIKDNGNSVIGRSIGIYSGSYPCDSATMTDAEIGSLVAYCTIGIGNIGYAQEDSWMDINGTNTASFDTSNTEAIGLALVGNTTVTKNDFVEGKVLFKAINATHMQVTADIKGLSFQAHGFHVHSFGDISTNDGQSIGGHYMKTGQEHSIPDNQTRHYGDFGNFCAFNEDMGTGYYNYITDYVKAFQVIGRGMAVHNNTDKGNSDVGGARCSQGIIALIEDEDFSLNTPEDWKYDLKCLNGAYKGGYDSSFEQSMDSEGGIPSSTSSIAPFITLVLISIIFVLF